MAKEWNASVKRGGRLSVFNNLPATWSGLFQPCLTEFNQLLSRSGINLQLETGRSENTANVVIGSGSGQVTFTYGSQTFERTVAGNILHGRAYQLANQQNKIEKTYIFVPATPNISAPGRQRPAGSEVKKAIFLHELVHACGLENSDHSRDDFFIDIAQTDPGSTPDRDRLGIDTSRGRVLFPPYFFSAGTIGKISGIW